MFAYITLQEVFFRLFIAVFLAFLIGLDRELKHKPFGFRPYMMVSLGSAAFALILMELAYGMEIKPDVNIDPSRVIQGIITGLGFLGAGAVIRAEKHVVGATTGSGIWVVGAIGLACGLGFYWYATIITLFALFIVIAFGKIHEKLTGERDDTNL